MSLVEKLKNCEDALFGKGVTNEIIEKAEKSLNTIFSKEYKEYLEKYGVAAVDGHELTGLCKIERVNVVNVTEEQRKYNSGIDRSWYVIEETHIDGIVIWQDPDGRVYQTSLNGKAEMIADSIEHFLDK